MTGFLRVEGTRIVNEDGKEVILRGAGLGGWMTMENFITGYPGCEFQIRAALADVLGPQKAAFYFDKFLEHFFGEADAAFFKSLGLNCIRIAVNYRHFEDDMNPRVLKPEGFKHLDRVVATCAKHGIYTIIDMHTAPGGQSGGWHCDSGTHIANFWIHKDFQDRLVWLWGEIAKHYKDEKWIAGYNPMNEPADPKHLGVVNFYDRVYSAITTVDPNHMLFLDGNTYASDFSRFPDDAATRWPNAAYSIHDYTAYGFKWGLEPYEDTAVQRTRVNDNYTKKRAWMDARGLCVWNGEWGPGYASREQDGDAMDELNERRYKLLKYQLGYYAEDRLSWSIWLYKDIGFQGMVYVSRETPYMQLFKDFLEKKRRLAVDLWGADDKDVRHIYKPIVKLIENNVSNKEHLKLYPYPVGSVGSRVTTQARNILVGEFLVKEWAEHFRGMSEEDLEKMAESFKFENCIEREGLNKALREHAETESGTN